LKILKNLFQDGIDLCKKNVLDYLNEAKMIIRKGSLHHAYVSVQLAIEEMGKAIWLKDELKNSSTDPVDVPNVIFGIGSGKESHKRKFEKASKMLNPDLLHVCKGIFNRKIFDPNIFDVGKQASPETRLENAYVNFYEKTQKWSIGCNIDKSALNALIRNIEQVVSAL
jgi:AbiV family abortive infection protein